MFGTLVLGAEPWFDGPSGSCWWTGWRFSAAANQASRSFQLFLLWTLRSRPSPLATLTTRSCLERSVCSLVISPRLCRDLF